MNYFSHYALFVCFVCAGIPTHAQDRNEVAALQYALAQHGFYSGTVDGLSGKGTQAAIKAFADKYGVENAFWPVASEMSVKTFWEADWTDAAEKTVMRELELYLADAGSAKIDERILYRTDDGASVCVNVNAKNTYGAYAGYRWLYFTLVEINFTKSPAPLLEDMAVAVGPANIGEGASKARCMLGFVHPK